MPPEATASSSAGAKPAIGKVSVARTGPRTNAARGDNKQSNGAKPHERQSLGCAQKQQRPNRPTHTRRQRRQRATEWCQTARTSKSRLCVKTTKTEPTHAHTPPEATTSKRMVPNRTNVRVSTSSDVEPRNTDRQTDERQGLGYPQEQRRPNTKNARTRSQRRQRANRVGAKPHERQSLNIVRC